MRLSKRIRAHPLYWTIKLFLKRLVGRELWLRPDVAIETSRVGGWQFSKTHLRAASIVYSLGIGDSIAFDLGLIEARNVTVHAFDPTPFAVEWIAGQKLPERFVFHQWAVGGTDGVLKMVPRVGRKGRKSKVMWTAAVDGSDDPELIEVPCYSLRSIMAKLEHATIDLLKMDVEGSEYEIIDSLVELERKPPQLLVEFHHRFPGIGQARTIESIRKLKDAGYRIFTVSETGRELGFIHESELLNGRGRLQS